jgi:predicted RNase H-like HicB family nuclease
MQGSFTATVWREGDWYVAECREVEVASQGHTEDEALASLAEALRLHFRPPCATLVPGVR